MCTICPLYFNEITISVDEGDHYEHVEVESDEKYRDVAYFLY
jgi:hypothetical protein